MFKLFNKTFATRPAFNYISIVKGSIIIGRNLYKNEKFCDIYIDKENEEFALYLHDVPSNISFKISKLKQISAVSLFKKNPWIDKGKYKPVFEDINGKEVMILKKENKV